MKKNKKKNKTFNANQKSFYFEDFLETNQKEKSEKISQAIQDRIYLLFFLFFSLIAVFSIKILFVSLKNYEVYSHDLNSTKFKTLRRDIVDRNGILISRNVKTYHAAVNPRLIKDKKNFLLKIRINFPEIPIQDLEKKLAKKKYFYLKKRLRQSEKEKLWSLGEKGLIFEPFQSRIYTHANLFSHILGQVDYDNYGISGVEKYFDKTLKDKNLISKPLQLTLDTNIQHIINDEMSLALKTFKASGGGALLMNANNGEVLSLVSLPNFDINKREKIIDKNYINKITKGVYELGSIFKTFTIALALEKQLVTPKTMIEGIPKKIKCSIHEISDIKKFPDNLSVEEILVRSSNVGSTKIAKKIGKETFKEFFKETNLLEVADFELEEIGKPLQFKWDKCKLETISFGHGISVTPLQTTAIYGALTNGGNLIKPTILKKDKYIKYKKIFSTKTSYQINQMLRQVVSGENGTASLADIYGYNVGGKTGTSENYENNKKNMNTFISVFPLNKPEYVLLVMLENPKPAPNLIYDYRGVKTKVNRSEAGWNSVYVAGKIIKKIGPILAIKEKDSHIKYASKKLN